MVEVVGDGVSGNSCEPKGALNHLNIKVSEGCVQHVRNQGTLKRYPENDQGGSVAWVGGRGRGRALEPTVCRYTRGRVVEDSR